MSFEFSLESPHGLPLDASPEVDDIRTDEPTNDQLPVHSADKVPENETEEDRMLKQKVNEWVKQAFNYAQAQAAEKTTDPKDLELRKKVLTWTKNISSFGTPDIHLRDSGSEPVEVDPAQYILEEKVQTWIRQALKAEQSTNSDL